MSKYELTFDEWDTCAAYGDCPKLSATRLWARTQPVINVTWDDAQRYVAWLSKMTGKTYRLLTEAEYEYATRAGTTTVYPWGDDIGQNNANCKGCGSQWDDKQTAPVGSFSPNNSGFLTWLAMFGSGWRIAPMELRRRADGWLGVDRSGDCNSRFVRGGSWSYDPVDLRSAYRLGYHPDARGNNLGSGSPGRFLHLKSFLTPQIFASFFLGFSGSDWQRTAVLEWPPNGRYPEGDLNRSTQHGASWQLITMTACQTPAPNAFSESPATSYPTT